MHKSSRNMWHEARKQEKKIRCMLVDYQRRAQRRKDYYDKIKADPTQFLQLHGRPCKIHLDPAVCIAANSSVTMMPWQGNTDVMIDRFDVRAHLDIIPEVRTAETPNEDLSYEERQINYERYRILVQNDFFSIPEDKFLHQINLEEKFGPVLKNVEQEPAKKRSTVAIGYNYEDDNTVNPPLIRVEEPKKDITSLNPDEENDEDSESDIDLDLTVDVSKIETQQANELNTCAHAYGMITNDFFSFLNNDLEEAENLRMAREQEEEKAMFSGRKSRKERRAFRERTLVGRKLSPPSYAWRKSPSYEDYKALVSSNRSRSKSTSPLNSGKITYITSFGGDEPAANTIDKSATSTNSTNDKDNYRKRIRSRSISRDKDSRTRRPRYSRSSSGERRRSCRSRSRSRSRNRMLKSSRRNDSRSEKRYRRTSSSRSRSHSPQQNKSPARIPSPKLTTPADNNSNPSGSGGSSLATNSTENKVIPRYYGRRKEESSSELSLSSDDDSSKQSPSSKNKLNQAPGPSRLNTSIKTNSTDKLTPQERLKRKRQVLLNKQFKADKRAEREKVLKMVQERIDRAEEMKEISIKLRRRQRMLRHNDSPRRHSHSSSRSRSSSNEWRSSSRSPRRSHRRNDRHRSLSDEDSGETDRKRLRRRRDSYSSRSRSRGRSRSRSRTPRRRSRYSEERGGGDRRDDRGLKNIKESDKTPRQRRYCTLSEERELARAQLESKPDKNDASKWRPRSPKRKLNDSYVDENDRRDRTWNNERNRPRYSNRRSNSRDRYSRYDY